MADGSRDAKCPQTDIFENEPYKWKPDEPPSIPPECPPGSHRWVVTGPVKLVRGTPAGRMFCVKCHRLQFSWLPLRLRGGGA